MGVNLNQRNINIIEIHRRETRFRRQYNEGMLQQLRNYGLNLMEAEILFAICVNVGCDTVTGLCADLGKSKGVVSQACDRLCKEGFLSGKVDKNDRRVIHFKITPAVRSVVNSVSRYMDSMDYVYHAKQQPAETDVLLCAMLDAKKRILYPIAETLFAENVKKGCNGLPFRSYDDFLKEQLLPMIPAEEREEIANAVSPAAVLVGLAEGDSIQKKIPLHINKSSRDVALTVSKIDGRPEDALIEMRYV